jgi:2-dehydropantoate 2-reductase
MDAIRIKRYDHELTKVCIVGAGAIGGFLGVRIAAQGEAEVTALARGATLDALREHGWRLQMDGQLIQSPVTACDDAAELGVQDIVFIAVKGPAMKAIAAAIGPLIGDDTVVVPAMNGVPWWFAQSSDEIGGGPLQSVDPGGHISSAIPLQKVLGAVVHAAASRPEPGLVEHKMGHGLIIGEPSGESTDRSKRVVKLLSAAGFDVTISKNIRSDIWYKLWGNMTMNPISAITGATADLILADTLVRDFCSNAMREAAAIGNRIGCPIDEDPEERHAVTAKLGAFKTSMLQDAEAGRQIELDAIVGAVHEIGTRLDMPIPYISALLGLTRLFGQNQDIYPSGQAEILGQ